MYQKEIKKNNETIIFEYIYIIENKVFLFI